MLATGDLVQIHDNAFKYFAGKLAIVGHLAHCEEYYTKDGAVEQRLYYLVTLAGTTNNHIFPEDELKLLSKAQKKNI